MKRLRLIALIAAALGFGILAEAQYTPTTLPNTYGKGKLGTCYVPSLNNWVQTLDTTANFADFPIQCDAQGNIVGFNVNANILHSSVTYTNAEFSNGTCTTALTVNPANGNRQSVTLTHGDACALTFTQPATGTITISLKIIQSAVSSYNGTISGCKWPGGTVPTITATSGAIDIITAYLDGTNAYCTAQQAFS